MTRLKLSIVVPSLNQGDFIGRTLDSIVRQYDHGNIEVIVRDAMSDDQTADVFKRYRQHDWIAVTRQHDDGQSDALATGFAAATGDILCWLNSDDILCPGAVEHTLSKFSEDPEIDVLFGDAAFIDEQDQVVGRFPISNPTLTNLRHRCVISQPSVFFRRSAYEAVGGLNRRRRFCMDYELWTRFAVRKFRFERTRRVLSCTRLHPRTKTATGGAEFVREICDMQRELLGSVSPVWQVYRLTRESDLMHTHGKLSRFAAATSQIIASNPTRAPQLGFAAIERASAEIRARFRRLAAN